MGDEVESNRKKSLDGSTDLISNLPRNVIDLIVEQLPLYDAARLSVLSRKWRDIWTSIPHLNFNAHFFYSVLQEKVLVTYEFSSIVSKILFQHNDPILKFSLCIPNLDLMPDINQWISFLSRRGVRELTLENHYKLPLKLSSLLFSFMGLETLKLHYCVLSPPPKFMVFRKLVNLKLSYIRFKEGTLQDFITRCPLLKNLSITRCVVIEHIDIDISGLKCLVVDGTFRSLCVRVVENLVSVAIVPDKLTSVCHNIKLRDLIEHLVSSSKLERLCLGGYVCKVLFDECLTTTTLKKLGCLILPRICLGDPDSFSSVVRTVQSCPNIQNLKISVTPSSIVDIQMFYYNPIITLNHLRYAKVTVSRASNAELKLIEFLLVSSPVLEVLSIMFLRPTKSSYQLRISNHLNQFQRASPKVKVTCYGPSDIKSLEFGDSYSSYQDSGESYASYTSNSASDSSYESSGESYASYTSNIASDFSTSDLDQW